MNAKDAILNAMLEEASFSGWTQEAFLQAVENAGYARDAASVYFPGGCAEVADHFIARMDTQLKDEAATLDLSALSIRKRIATLVMLRLTLYEPYREAMHGLASFFAFPINTPCALRHSMETASLIWYLAGDTSTDYNWYTKRFLLSGIYSATLLYWLKDESEDYQATREFLDRRIEDVMQIEKAKAKLTGVADSLLARFAV